ncbi:MAG: Ribosomal RNA small subunit methyltransferase B [Erysipelotrichaceae bacterium]|nr:MAG: Ribosomal RNA small subunit methyltransferase [Erysipelotrichaceae bacterium]TXT16892.1 MAG: Ribosomal RNA small subunit methyltransferase B [Erysipelotrichaceae bacterium]
MKNPRALAHAILCDVVLNGQFANLALKQRLQNYSDQDKNLISALVYTTLRHQISARAQWIDLVENKPKEKVALILDLAIIQMFYFDRLPEYAIVDESVELAKVDHISSAGMVNAVLRKVTLRGQKELVGKDEIETQALNLSIPLWIYKLWIKHYGQDEAYQIALSLNQEAPLCARINTLKVDPKEIYTDKNIQRGYLSPLSIRSDTLSLLNTDWFKEGKIVIQDESSQLVTHFSGVRPNDRVLDLCSAPGSKSTAMAALMNNTGSILACDLYASRLELVEKQAQLLGVTNLITLCIDGRVLKDTKPQPFDVILIDAPCSGLGVMRHKPDIKIHLKPETLDELISLQYQLLDSVADLTKINGTLVYSTCTLNRKENELQIVNFLSHHPNYVLVDERLILPYECDSDGFYMAKLKRLK